MCSGVLCHAGVPDVYRKGTIKIIPDPNFGKGVDWGGLFFDGNRDLLVTPGGSLFVANNRSHNFYKFGPDGKLMGTYGRRGRGPGDLYSPHLYTCLDGKYLVLGEYAANRKISVFDFLGNCVTTIRTPSDCFGAIGLKRGYIAYYSRKTVSEIKDGKSTAAISIHIVHMDTKDEIEFPFGVITEGYIKAMGNSVITMGQNYLGDFILKKTGDGNLLVGTTNSPLLKIFSPQGKLIKTFRLNIKPIPVTGRYIEKQREAIIDGLHKKERDREVVKMFKKAIEKSDFENLFGEILPYYRTIVVDSEGNFLVFKWLASTGKTDETFQVYSPAGTYICETTLDKGRFDIDVARNFQTMQFTSSAFYGIVKDAEDEDNIRLVKVPF
jgi:hypothetical protein